MTKDVKNKIRAALNYNDEDRIVTAWAEKASGPGWHNTPIWVLIQNSMGSYRIESLQPDEQTRDMRVLHSISDTVSYELTQIVKYETTKENDI